MALLGFSSAIIAGLWVGNPFETILTRAWLTLVMFFILGAIAGAFVQAVIDEHRLQKILGQQEENEANEQNTIAEMQRESLANETSGAGTLTS